MPDLPFPTALPDLPDLEELLRIAKERKAHYLAEVNKAQAEVDKAQDYINALTAKRPKSTRRNPDSVWNSTVSEKAIDTVFRALGERQHFVHMSRLAADVKLSPTTVGRAIHVLEGRGLVQTETRRRLLHAKLSDAGIEAYTRPELGDA